ATTAILKQINFPRRIQRFLQTIDFPLPQQNSTVQHHFCNESVYGKFTFLEAVGLLRLNTPSDVMQTLSSFISIPALTEIVTDYLSGEGSEPESTLIDGKESTRRGTKEDITSRPDAREFIDPDDES